MGKSGLSGNYVADAAQSFKMICIGLLDVAYSAVAASGRVTSEWQENAITELIAGRMNDNPTTIHMHISVNTEKKLVPDGLSQAQPTVDNAPRIDIQIGGFECSPNEKRVAYYMEAKNLYSHDFKKSNNSTVTQSSAYAKRYIQTGIDHLLDGYYPENTLLLGYVLVGTVNEAVDIVNAYLKQEGRGSEEITLAQIPSFPHLVFGASGHPGGKSVDHCYLLFEEIP